MLLLFIDIAPTAALMGVIAGDLTSVLPVHGVASMGTYEAGGSPDYCLSKGPLLAWLIALSEAMFGHGEWQVRLFGWLAHGILLALVFFFAHDVWGNRRAAWWAVIIILLTPLYFTLGMVMSTDIFIFTLMPTLSGELQLNGNFCVFIGTDCLDLLPPPDF